MVVAAAVEVENSPALEEAGAFTAPTPGFIPTSLVDNATATPGSFRLSSTSPHAFHPLFHLPIALLLDFLPLFHPQLLLFRLLSFFFLSLPPEPLRSDLLLASIAHTDLSRRATPLVSAFTPLQPLSPTHTLRGGETSYGGSVLALLLSSWTPCALFSLRYCCASACSAMLDVREREEEAERVRRGREMGDTGLFVRVGSNRQPSGWKGRDVVHDVRLRSQHCLRLPINCTFEADYRCGLCLSLCLSFFLSFSRFRSSRFSKFTFV